MCVFLYQELLWGEGGLVLPVVGLVHLSAHPACYHWGHSLPLWPCLLQQLTPHVSFSTTNSTVSASKLFTAINKAVFLCYRKEVCEADIVMCPLCDRRCKVWQLSDTCTYAKVHECIYRTQLNVCVSVAHCCSCLPTGEPTVR